MMKKKEEKEKIGINVCYEDNNRNHRSLTQAEAFLYRNLHTIEVYIESQGHVNIYIINENEEVIDYKTTNSNIINITELHAYEIGYYKLIIESEYFYAEGQFTI